MQYIDLGPSISPVDEICCCCLLAKSCQTICDPMDYSPPGPSVHGILENVSKGSLTSGLILSKV